MRCLLTALLLLFMPLTWAQVDPQKLDSLKRSIDAQAKKVQAWQDSFTRQQESLYRSQALKQSAPARKAPAKKEERKERQGWVRVMIAGLFVTLLLFLLLRNRRSKKN